MKTETNRPITFRYHHGRSGVVNIPVGTPVIPATNIPGNSYWVDGPWDGIEDHERSILDSIGIRIDADDVSDCN